MMNALEQMWLVRDLINEATAAHWSDVNLVKRLNVAQRKVYLKVAMTYGQWLVTSASVTPSASVITLPADCGKPLYLEETTSGRPITWLNSLSYRRVSRLAGATLDTTGAREAYPLASTIEVNETSYTTACTLWYQRRAPDLHAGDASAAAASSITLAADSNRVYLADYYKGATIEQYNAAVATATYVAFRSAITASTAAGACTVTGTPTNAYGYGTVSILPEETHQLMAYMAAVDAVSKPGSTIDEKSKANLVSDMADLKKDVYAWLETRIPESYGVTIGDNTL